MTTFEDSGPLPRAVLEERAMVEACGARDIGAVFRLAKDAGVYYSRIARLCDMTASRVADYATGRLTVRRQAVLERVADGLRIPGRMLGLAVRPWEGERGGGGSLYIAGPEVIGPHPSCVDRAAVSQGSRAVIATNSRRTERILRVEALSGAVVETAREVDIDIDAEGRAVVGVRLAVRNLSERPLTRLHHEVWFERTAGRVDVRLLGGPGAAGRMRVEGLYGAGPLAKFTVRFLSPVAPGDSARMAYACVGGVFADRFYWRQTVSRPIERLSLRVRQRGVRRILGWSAVEEHRGGAETAVPVEASRANERMELRLNRHDLVPGQAVVLRWRIDDRAVNRGAS